MSINKQERNNNYEKTYIMPLTAIVNIAMQQIMAGSTFTTDASGDVTGGELQSGNATGKALGRSSLWDDDED